MGHFIFETETEAIAAIQKINEGEGLPISEDATTQSYCDYFLNEDGKWQIIKNTVTSKHLDEEDS